MKKIIILLACVVLCSGLPAPCAAQQAGNDEVLLERIVAAYHGVPQDLKVDEVMHEINKVDKQATRLIDSISGNEAKQKARLLRYTGLLWSLGEYVLATGDQTLKSELAERINGLDLDSPHLDLLNEQETFGLLDNYFRVFMPDISLVQRGTHVLYNIKSEQVRNYYVLPFLEMEIRQRGYTDAAEQLIEDIELCSKTEATIRRARELKEIYYPMRAGVMAPDFEMENEHGKMVKLSDFRGKAVFIDVWSTVSDLSVSELPAFVALREQYKDREDVVFMTITINNADAKSYWRKFLKEKKYSGKVHHLIVNEQKDQFPKDYCITHVPRYILIDKSGKIVNAWHVSVRHDLFPWVFNAELESRD